MGLVLVELLNALHMRQPLVQVVRDVARISCFHAFQRLEPVRSVLHSFPFESFGSSFVCSLDPLMSFRDIPFTIRYKRSHPDRGFFFAPSSSYGCRHHGILARAYVLILVSACR